MRVYFLCRKSAPLLPAAMEPALQRPGAWQMICAIEKSGNCDLKAGFLRCWSEELISLHLYAVMGHAGVVKKTICAMVL